MTAALLLAQVPRTTGWEHPLFWASLPLIGILLLGALVIYLVDRWRKQTAPPTDSAAADQLSHFRELYEKGQISREEYERVRALLAGQLRRDFQVPAPAPDVQPDPKSPPGPQGLAEDKPSER